MTCSGSMVHILIAPEHAQYHHTGNQQADVDHQAEGDTAGEGPAAAGAEIMTQTSRCNDACI